MPIVAIRIQEALWKTATDARKHEWRVLADNLLDDRDLATGMQDASMVVGADRDGFFVEVTPTGGETLSVRFGDSPLGALVGEYLHVVRAMMGDDVHATRLEALDMAKRVVHDKAADALARAMPWMSDAREPFRRLFSLMVALVEDTTKLSVVHRHRR